jgi:hypothetical protein
MKVDLVLWTKKGANCLKHIFFMLVLLLNYIIRSVYAHKPCEG